MRVGLALSGGGARGIGHLGVLKALEELGIEIHEISGTSAGAMAAAFYTHGYSPEETLDILTKTKLSKAIWPSFGLKGLLSTSKGQAIFAKYLDYQDFEKASIPLKIAVTNLNTGRGEIFSSGPLVKSIMASSCIPIMFEPVEINGQLYVDGGIANNLPAECLRDSCDVVIGVNAVPIIPQEDLKGVKKLIERVSMIALSANVNTSAALCDLVIKPNDLRKYGTLNLRHANEIFELGYDYTHHVFEVNKDKAIIQRLLGKVEDPVSIS